MHHKTETQDAEDTVTLDAPSADLSAVIDKFPVTKSYTKDGYIGDLTLDLQSIKVAATGYRTVTDSHPHSVTKTYELPYNCLLYTSPSPRDGLLSRMPSSA